MRFSVLSKLFLNAFTEFEFCTAVGRLFHELITLCEKKFDRKPSLQGFLTRPNEGATESFDITVACRVAYSCWFDDMVKNLCGSISSILWRILNVSIMSPLNLRFSNESILSTWSFSSYEPVRPETALTALCWTFSSITMSCWSQGFQAWTLYSRWGRTYCL